MYDKKDVFKIATVLIVAILILLFVYLFTGCQSTKGLRDNGIGVDSIRELQSDIRDRETELAITSTEISNDSDAIAETSKRLENQLGELEESIGESEVNEQEVGEILQRIRTREVPKDKLTQLGIKF